MSIKREKFKVYDMTCTSCENKIEKTLKQLNGVITAKASYSKQEVIVEYNTEFCDITTIKDAIKSSGYSIESSNNYKIVGIFIVVAAIILLGNSTGGFDMNSKLNGASYFVLFIVGMFTSLHCVGMCGGIMLSQSISKESSSKFQSVRPAILYNAGRVVAYTLIGGLVGALGSVLSLSLNVKAGLQIFAGLFMIIMGLNMAGFSMFRKFNIKLPFSACSIKKKPKTPFFVGLLNGLMPCGPLQTMQLYALGTGSALNGALSMLLFSLGTVPLMLTFGALSGLLSKGYTKKILKMSGFLVIILGFIMGSRGLALAGVNLPNSSVLGSKTVSSSSNSNSTSTSASQSNVNKAVIKDGIQEITMTVDGSGYTPDTYYVKKNMPVKWIIKGNALNSCNSSIVVPAFNIQKALKSGDNVIEFTPKDKDISFSCWMGMIRGVIKVTDNLDTPSPSTGSDNTSSVDDSTADIPAPSSGGMGCCSVGDTSSIYGSDLSKVPTDKLVKKATISKKSQSVELKGINNDFDPLIVVVSKSLKTSLAIDLTSFTNPDGEFDIIDTLTGKTVTSFNGQKGIVNVNFTLPNSETLYILKDGNKLCTIDIESNLESADIEKIRAKFLNNGQTETN